jgi:hypothetical protein
MKHVATSELLGIAVFGALRVGERSLFLFRRFLREISRNCGF